MEIKAFREITLNQPQTLSELAEAMQTSQSYTSTILNKMAKKGLVQKKRDGKNKTPQLADTPHASTLRNMILNSPQNSLDHLANKGTRILSPIICQNIRDMDQLETETQVSYRTLWKYMTKAKNMGLITMGGQIKINPRHENVAIFVERYTRYLNETKARRHSDDALVKWSCGDNYLFETRKTLDLQRTGISVFVDFGALFLSVTTLYTNSKEPLRLEDHLINHLLSEGTENMLPLLITWKLNEEEIDQGYLKESSHKHRVHNIIESTITYLKTQGAQRPNYLINWNEFNDKLREYSQ